MNHEPLGRYATVKSGFAFKSKDWVEEGIPVIKIGNVKNGSLDLGGCSYVTEEVAESASAFRLKRGDLLISMTGHIGEVALVRTSEHLLLNQRVGRLTVTDHRQLCVRFLYYCLQVPEIKASLVARAYGAAQPNISPTLIEQQEIPLPPIATQRKIASILSAYDDLIENNARRIAILEEMAQSLYREWFVEFRFPGHEKARFIDSPLGKIPAAWKPWRLEDWAEEVRRSVDPSEIEPDTPYFGLEHLPRRSITLTDWGRAGDVQSTKLAFNAGEILFGKIRPYFHKVGIAPVDGVCSTDAIVVVPREPQGLAPVLCCISSDDFISHATQTSQGTKMPRANWGVLLKYPLPCPAQPLLREFSDTVGDFLSQLRVLMKKNRTLRTTRDLLLPKLMSGQLDVEDLDIDIGESLAEADA